MRQASLVPKANVSVVGRNATCNEVISMIDLEMAKNTQGERSSLRLPGMSRTRGLCAVTSIRMTGIALSFVVMLLFASFAPRANAQLSTAQISGSVLDQAAALIPGAEVTATQTATGVVTKTTANDQGFFVLPSLAVGSYTLEVKAPGFKPYRQTNLVLTVGQQLTVKVALQVGGSDEVVTVTASSVSVDSTSPTEQSTVSQEVVQNLPLNGRNPASLMFTVAGVTDATSDIPPSDVDNSVKEADAASPGESAPSVHGSRPGGTYYSLDGASNTDPFTVIGAPFPNPDATGEFSVVTGTFGARYVSAPGGAINIVTKSGTNQVHGSVFEFIRNGYFNARNALSTNPDILKRNQFGFAMGAPLVKDRLFVFGTYQATPVRNSITTHGIFPTAAQLAGNFGTFTVPKSLFSPAIQKLLPYIPVGSSTGTANAPAGTLFYQTPDNTNEQQGLIKIDLDSGKHRDFARAFYDRYLFAASQSSGAGLLLAAHSGYIQPWESGALGDNWTLGKFVLDSRISYSRELSTQVPSYTSSKTDPESFSNMGVTGMSGEPVNSAYNVLDVIGAFNTILGQTSRFPRKELEVSEDVFATAGKQQISFGASYKRVTLNESNPAGEDPDQIFYGANIGIDGGPYCGFIPGATCIPGATANPMADFLMGESVYFIQGDGLFQNISGNLFGLYAEDNIRLTKKLTATAGLRWDPFFPYTIAGGRASCYSPGAPQSTKFPNSFPGLLFAGDQGCPEAGVAQSMKEFQPRVGLAYQLDSKGNTVIRSGYGRYDLQFLLNSFDGFSAQPFIRQYLVQAPFISVDHPWASLGLTDPFAAGFHGPSYNPPQNITFNKGATTSTFDKGFRPGYIQQWSLSIQRLITAKDSVDIAYVGTEGTHLTLTHDLNLPTNVTAANPSGTYPNSNFTTIYDLASDATSSYNGLDVTFRHQAANASLTSAFSWSKALDDNSQGASSDIVRVPTPGNHNFRRGRSDYDQNLDWRTTGTYSTPKLTGANAVVRSVAGSWVAAGLLTLDAGQPFSVGNYAQDSGANLTVNIDYADHVSGVPAYVNGKLNKAAFQANAIGTFGNTGRNAYRGPAYKDVDMALIKDVSVREKLHVTFRAEAFDIFNHPNYFPPAHEWGPAGTPDDSSFGTYTTARDPRILQFSVKLTF